MKQSGSCNDALAVLSLKSFTGNTQTPPNHFCKNKVEHINSNSYYRYIKCCKDNDLLWS